MKCKIFVSSLLIQFLLLACQKESIPIVSNIDYTTVTYANVIEPMAQQNCDGSNYHGGGTDYMLIRQPNTE